MIINNQGLHLLSCSILFHIHARSAETSRSNCCWKKTGKAAALHSSSALECWQCLWASLPSKRVCTWKNFKQLTLRLSRTIRVIVLFSIRVKTVFQQLLLIFRCDKLGCHNWSYLKNVFIRLKNYIFWNQITASFWVPLKWSHWSF